MQIFVESTELSNASRSLTTINNSLRSIRQTISNITNRQSTTWQGRAQAQNAANFRHLDQRLADYLHQSLNTARVLEQAVSQYARDEQDRTRTVTQLDTSNIF